MKVRATIKDVAELSGTSVGTVSRFLNSGRCHPTRRQRIEEAIRSLGYVPNLNARATRAERSYSIAILIAERCTGNGFWIQSLLTSLFVHFSQSKFRAFSQIVDTEGIQPLATRLPGNADGIIAIGHFPAEFYQMLEMLSIPAVTYWEPLPCSNGVSLPVELEGGFTRLIEHLLAFGHRKIGILGSTTGINPEKAELFLEIIRHYLPGFPAEHVILSDEEDMRKCGQEITQQFLTQVPGGSAIFYLSDSIVLGGLGELSRRKIVVPDDISIASFDNSHLALSMEPSLTSVGFSYDEIATEMVSELTRRIYAGNEPIPTDVHKIPLQFYPRHSTGPASQEK